MTSVIRTKKPIYNDSFNFMEMMLLVTLHNNSTSSWSFQHCEWFIITFTSWDNAGCLQNKSCPAKLPDDVDVLILSLDILRHLLRLYGQTNQMCSYTIFNGCVMYVMLGNSHRSGIVYIQLP